MMGQSITRRLLLGATLASLAVAAFGIADRFGVSDPAEPQVIGPTAAITEVSSGVEFTARVDTGAASTSLHCTPEDFVIVDPSDDPLENLNKPARVRIENRLGDASWIETRIIDYVEVRNAEAAEGRYKIRLPLYCQGVQKEAVVNLNDRSHMSYRMLLGRDFLAGQFLVDVARDADPSL